MHTDGIRQYTAHICIPRSNSKKHKEITPKNYGNWQVTYQKVLPPQSDQLNKNQFTLASYTSQDINKQTIITPLHNHKIIEINLNPAHEVTRTGSTESGYSSMSDNSVSQALSRSSSIDSNHSSMSDNSATDQEIATPKSSSRFKRKNAMRSPQHKTDKIHQQQTPLENKDKQLLIERFKTLKDSFYHVGDYLPEDAKNLTSKIETLKIPHSSEQKPKHANQLWNRFCLALQKQLTWSTTTTLTPLSHPFKKLIHKRKAAEEKRSHLYSKLSTTPRKYSTIITRARMLSQTKTMQRKVEQIKDEHYQPQLEQILRDLQEKTLQTKSRQEIERYYEQLYTMLDEKARDIPSEIDKWSKNLLLNRTFIESNLTPKDVH